MDLTKLVRVVTTQHKVTTDREKSEKHCDVSVVSFSVVQNTARQAMKDKKYAKGRERLLATQKMLDRCATTDEQQEEYDIFIREVETLDGSLMDLLDEKAKKSSSDKATKVFLDLQSLPHVQFQAGSKKDISSRKKHVGEYKQLL